MTNLPAALATDYTDAGTPTGATTELPATTSRGLNAITGAVNTLTTVLGGASNPLAITGGTLDGVTIGATTAAQSVNATTLKQNAAIALSGTDKLWLNQSSFYYGTHTGSGNFNYLGINDEVQGDTNFIYGLKVENVVASPAIGLRGGIFGHVWAQSAGANTRAQAQYVAVVGRAEISSSLGGTAPTASGAIGSACGGWFFAALNAGTNLSAALGVEIDTYIASGATAFSKVGLAIVDTAGSTVRGSVEDIAVCIANQVGATTWQNGIMFGRNGSGSFAYQNWPFDSTSTMITASAPGSGTQHANIGIDFTNVAFADAAIKVGPATIELSEMASAPAQVAGVGRLYVASDGSLHYLGPTTDTQLAPA